MSAFCFAGLSTLSASRRKTRNQSSYLKRGDARGPLPGDPPLLPPMPRPRPSVPLRPSPVFGVPPCTQAPLRVRVPQHARRLKDEERALLELRALGLEERQRPVELGFGISVQVIAVPFAVAEAGPGWPASAPGI